jgi:hypothetical protein
MSLAATESSLNQRGHCICIKRNELFRSRGLKMLFSTHNEAKVAKNKKKDTMLHKK